MKNRRHKEMRSQFSTTILPWACKPQIQLDPTTQVQPDFLELHVAASLHSLSTIFMSWANLKSMYVKSSMYCRPQGASHLSGKTSTGPAGGTCSCSSTIFYKSLWAAFLDIFRGLLADQTPGGTNQI